jgi:short subunit dehydrogenase-like uncharacterized protein
LHHFFTYGILIDMNPTFLLYGSYGYTGSLIAELAVQHGYRPLLAGRDEAKLRTQAQALGLEYRAFPLEDQIALESAIKEVPAVLHCAGPFSYTYKAMSTACLNTGRHYLDITGEIPVFEALAKRDEEARQAGVILLPGVGFDVVPSDCLAAHLKRLLPTATWLTLAICTLGGGMSRGTALTGLEPPTFKAAVRRKGKLKYRSLASNTFEVNFGPKTLRVMGVSWGDVSTAYYSTGIPNIDVYMAFPKNTIRLARLGRFFVWIPRLPPIKNLIKRIILARSAGPSAEARQTGRSLLWGEVQDEKGWMSTARLETPDGYTLTTQTALRAVEKVIAGEVQPGFQTPSSAFGPDFILEFENIRREDI